MNLKTATSHDFSSSATRSNRQRKSENGMLVVNHISLLKISEFIVPTRNPVIFGST